MSSDPEALASLCHYLATSEFHDYCPLYERIALALADDRELLTRIAAATDGNTLVPVLLNAAVHDLVLAEPDCELATIYATGNGDPWPAYRRLLEERFDELMTTMQSRSIQTNEVGRAAVLLPVFGLLHAQFNRPLDLVELGCSAGLNLCLDRFHYRYSNGLTWGEPSSPVQIECDVVGDFAPPLPTRELPIERREGIDLEPIDITNPDDRRWLKACLWPNNPFRVQRMDAALELAERDPPVIHRGDAVELVAEVVRSGDPANLTVVFATWVLTYLPVEARHRLAAIFEELSDERPLAVVTGEYPAVAPWVPTPARATTAGETKGASVLGAASSANGALRTDALAWMHAHGQWIEWLLPYP
ncbi:MAG: DUF2332 domain-containing protein, partial [Acidimicrobiales bacterium]|nr:DUF2332 domain-containing protein [Acidimicrobiales bacterium]